MSRVFYLRVPTHKFGEQIYFGRCRSIYRNQRTNGRFLEHPSGESQYGSIQEGERRKTMILLKQKQL